VTIIQYAIARHKAQLDSIASRRYLTKREKERLHLLCRIVAEWESLESTSQNKDQQKPKTNVQSGT